MPSVLKEQVKIFKEKEVLSFNCLLMGSAEELIKVLGWMELRSLEKALYLRVQKRLYMTSLPIKGRFKMASSNGGMINQTKAHSQNPEGHMPCGF